MKIIKLFVCYIFTLYSMHSISQQAGLSGQYNTTLTKAWIDEYGCVTLDDTIQKRNSTNTNTNNNKVVRFSFTFSFKSIAKLSPNYGNCINDDFMEIIYSLSEGDRFFIDNIEAIDQNGIIFRPKGFYIRIGTDQIPVSVSPPVADFNISRDTIVVTHSCAYINHSSCCMADTYEWDFGDGTKITDVMNPEHCYDSPGSYTITLTISNQYGTDKMTKSITVVEPIPESAFSHDRSTIMVGTAVRFSNESRDCSKSYSWDFGDGEHSVEQNPTHIYKNSGKYTVSLITSNTAGSDTLTYVALISVYEKIMNTPCINTPTVTDYDGNKYNTVQIGNQCWMKENLRTTHYSDGQRISRTVYNYNGNKKKIIQYGLLYDWETISYKNVKTSQGICPTGWHVPDEEEGKVLFDYLEVYKDKDLNCKLMSTEVIWKLEKGKPTNETGFSAVPSDYYHYPTHTDVKTGREAYIWIGGWVLLIGDYKVTSISSSEHHLYGVREYQSNERNSVRCIKD